MNAPVVEGEVIAGKYRVDRVLGRGGMGIVVAASHLFLPQRVAIKLLLSDEDGSPALAQRFLREARAVVRLKGEHVVRVLDVGELDSGVPYIVMEYLDGEDLSEVLRERGPLSTLDAADYVLQVCVAMAEAHNAGIVHRDLKPANLFLTTTPGGAKLIKVLDFGISKELPGGSESGGASLTQTREMLGSPIYMSPEQMRSSRSVDARSDIWALGAILYRLLTGRPPFEASALAELVLQVASADPVRPTELRSDIPPALEAAILRCLEKDPAQRWPTVADLAHALAPFAPAGAMERAECAARILGAPPTPRPSAPAAGPELDTLSSAEPGPMETLPPTTRGLARTSAMPARRRTLMVALGAAAMASLALAAAIALRRGAPVDEARLSSAAIAQDDGAPQRAQPGVAGDPAGPLIASEPPATAREPAPAAPPQPSAAPVDAEERPAKAPPRRRPAAVPSSPPPAAPPRTPPPVEPTNPFAIPLK
ncbi:serine/threonine-protein kinase [Sorangium sp. So ce590]|uniref:serine/threonine-protein kinase n=1 Tax=unclassified Sorangium TaxID=2621164 RepID=UPI003F60F46F